MTVSDSAVLVASHQREAAAAAAMTAATMVAPGSTTTKKQSPTGMHVERSAGEAAGDDRSPLLQSRVGRDKQRYDGHARLLACIVPTRAARDAAALEVLVISSAKHTDEWILPKGGWDSDESVVECALREADEEAGVRADVAGCSGGGRVVTARLDGAGGRRDRRGARVARL